MRRYITPWQIVAVVFVVWLIPFWMYVGSGYSASYAALWPVHYLVRIANQPGGAFKDVPPNW